MKKYMYGVALAAAALLVPDMALAANLKGSLTSTTSNIAPAVTLISYAAWVFGALFVMTGLLKLRAHVDNPAQNPLKDALGRLFVGAMLGLLPAMIDFFRNTTAITSGTGAYSGLATLT